MKRNKYVLKSSIFDLNVSVLYLWIFFSRSVKEKNACILNIILVLYICEEKNELIHWRSKGKIETFKSNEKDYKKNLSRLISALLYILAHFLPKLFY